MFHKSIALSLVIMMLSTSFTTYAQTTTDTETIQGLQAPSQTTIFFTNPDEAKDIVESSDNTYNSQEQIAFSIEQAEENVNSLDEGVKQLRDQIIGLDRKYGRDDTQYLETRQEVIGIIKDIETTKDNMSKGIKQIYNYQRTIINTVQKVNEIRASIATTKENIEKFADFMYQTQNEYYTNNGVVDEIKLLIKSEGNINEQLANTAMVETVMTQMRLLLETLTAQEKQYILSIKESNNNRSEVRKLIQGYDQQLKNLQEQRKFLGDYLTLYESTKAKMSKELASLFSTRSEVYGDIASTIEQINSKKYNTTFDIASKLVELANTKPFADRDENAAPLSWPIYPIVLISRYFGDQDHQQKYNLPFQGIEIPAEQHTPLYAVDEGLVYKIANKDGIGLNWMLLIHNNERMTVYLYPNNVIVNEGDIVRRGQIIGYSGGEPGTRGAGFVAGGPNLTFMTIEQGAIVDPLTLLDLSVMQNPDDLPASYKFKYLKDKYNLPREMYKNKPINGNTIEERRQNLLNLYGVGIYRSAQFWVDAAADTNIDVDVGICIAFAESTMGRNLSTSNNIGNVGNNDGGDRIAYTSPLAGARLIYTTLNNRYLGGYHILLDYNGYGNPEGKNYATSKYNRQNNVTKCLTMIKGYHVPDDFPVRISPRPYGQGAIETDIVAEKTIRNPTVDNE